jgi:hypothetical protein
MDDDTVRAGSRVVLDGRDGPFEHRTPGTDRRRQGSGAFDAFVERAAER